MAFTVTLYNTTDPPNKLNKVLTGPSSAKSCTPYEPVSDLEGTIVIDYGFDYEGSNYLEMLEQDIVEGVVRASRTTYYFITDIEKVQGSKLRLYLKRDVLMTYKSDINKLDILVKRCTKQASDTDAYGYNSMLNDPAFERKCTRYYEVYPFKIGDPPIDFKFTYPANTYYVAVIG